MAILITTIIVAIAAIIIARGVGSPKLFGKMIVTFLLSLLIGYGMKNVYDFSKKIDLISQVSLTKVSKYATATSTALLSALPTTMYDRKGLIPSMWGKMVMAITIPLFPVFETDNSANARGQPLIIEDDTS